MQTMLCFYNEIEESSIRVLIEYSIIDANEQELLITTRIVNNNYMA